VAVAVAVAVAVGGGSGGDSGVDSGGGLGGGGSVIEVVVSSSMFVVRRVLSTVVDAGGARSICGEAGAVGFVVLGK
jgi:hypothetical protein